LFIIAAIPREARGKDFSWHHLRFLSPVAQSDKNKENYDEKSCSLQLYDNFLATLLEDVIFAQKIHLLLQLKETACRLSW
jgi:hypothetical protein